MAKCSVYQFSNISQSSCLWRGPVIQLPGGMLRCVCVCVCVYACLCTCVFLCAPQYEKTNFIVTFTPREENDVVDMIQIYEALHVALQDFGQQIADAFMKNTKLILLPATGISLSCYQRQVLAYPVTSDRY